MKTRSNRKKSVSISVLTLMCFVAFSVKAINPTREYAATPEILNIGYTEHKIYVDREIVLNSWVCLQPDLSKPFIIVSGTDAGNMSNSLGQLDVLYREGYNVILYDYRGFGASSDFDMDLDRMYYNEFATDLAAVISYVKKNYESEKVYLYGSSMGTIVSVMNANADDSIKGLILDSFVINPKLAAERLFKLKNKEILLPDDVDSYLSMTGRLQEMPILIFSGLKDPVTKTEDYDDFVNDNKHTRIVTCDGGHLECLYALDDASTDYVSEINSFVAEYKSK